MSGPGRVSSSIMSLVARTIRPLTATAQGYRTMPSLMLAREVKVRSSLLHEIWTGIGYLIAGLTLVWAIYLLSVKQVETRLKRQFNERLTERLRVAEELYDSLQQTIAASRMIVDDARDRPEDQAHTGQAMEQLSEWLQLAARDARAAALSLSMLRDMKGDLAASLSRSGNIP